jgi:hypothetical protein
MSLRESLGELLPMSSRPMAKLLRPNRVPIVGESEAILFPGLKLVYGESYL